MKYLKVVKHRPTQLKSWQILAVVGETKSQLEQRTQKSIETGMKLDEFSYEFKDYPIVKISDKEARRIKQGSKSDVKQVALNSIDNSKEKITDSPQNLIF